MIIRTKKKLTIPNLLKKAQIVFNRFIRNRDKNLGCISCGSEVTEAGHYYSAGHYSSLRFNEVNTNGQCVRCNRFLHGNLIHYRQGLVKRYGEQKVLLLDSAARSHKKWDRVSLEIIIKTYE